MELLGSQNLAATPDQVWAALFDRDVLEQSIPGCESLEQTSDTSFVAVVKLKIGPVSARFKGEIELSDIDPGKSCTLSGKGSGGIAGFAKGAALVTLTPEGDYTVLDYTADVAVGGKLAALGNRLIKSTAKKLTDEFFANFTKALTAEEEEPVT
ncbi:CoxG family protein [Parasedimentitalea psychrophila]|uniref:Carbon monoxide dehydrogenase subunit G n=1 Tax=Parasedimentitalea psychrophila TaxID=2997337 RepID=A0A9Y2P0M2_9RHOB|nr:carbon monoxide dehydrogenase subunit G [Parasedimentitalea psychrophila]WIY24736.1 carbon monoxide dehydrogenase subunit G [Parasedimentitalea psychrophila]